MPDVIELWRGTDVSIAEIEAQLARMRADTMDRAVQPSQRTSVMTHVAWVPPEWLEAAEATLEAIEQDRHPSRSVILVPVPDEESGLGVELSVRCFAAGDRAVASEVIRLHLRGGRAQAPASLVLPLAISDLPLFLRWRGEPPFGSTQFDQLVDVADRLVVDSSEWGELRYRELAAVFSRSAASDIEWARTYDWRVALTRCWPGIREQEIRVRGPRAGATLLRGWLHARLGRAIRPVESADVLGVRLGGEELRPALEPDRSPSELLSAELDHFGRDRVYEESVRATVGS